MEKKEENNELIAAFMGFPIKTKVTEHEYGYDFRDSYETKIIYSNINPTLVDKDEMFLTKVVATHKNYFDFDEQQENFDYLVYLNYDNSWDSLMPVVEKCKETLESIETEFESKERINFEENIFSLDETLEDFFTNNLEAIYRRCIEFIKWYYNYKRNGRILEN